MNMMNTVINVLKVTNQKIRILYEVMKKIWTMSLARNEEIV